MERKYYYLKHLCEKFHIYLTYEDPTTEACFEEAIEDLMGVLEKKRLIWVNPENGHIIVIGGKKNGRYRNAPRRKEMPRKKVLPVYGTIHGTSPVRG